MTNIPALTDMDHEIIRLWGLGKKQKEIATALGVTKNTVAGRVNRLRQRGVALASRDPAGNLLSPEIRAEKRREFKRQYDRARRNRAKSPMRGAGKRAVILAENKRALAEQAKAKEPLPDGTLLVPKKPMTTYNIRSAGKPPNITGYKQKTTSENKSCTTKFNDLKPTQCRYPVGGSPNMLFCDAEKITGSSYCADHKKLCTAPAYRT